MRTMMDLWKGRSPAPAFGVICIVDGNGLSSHRDRDAHLTWNASILLPSLAFTLRPDQYFAESPSAMAGCEGFRRVKRNFSFFVNNLMIYRDPKIFKTINSNSRPC